MTTVTAVPLQPVKRGYLIWLWLGIALACVSAFALARQGDPALVREARGKSVVTTASGLQYKVLKAGPAGAAKPTVTDVALVSYEGRLLDGAGFDKSQQPTPFPVAPGEAAELRQGCDKRLDTCRERFANVLNFRGEPHLPGNDLLTRYPGS